MTDLIVVIAEKPSVAKILADWLSRTLKFPAVHRGSHIAVGTYRVSWLFGHVLENWKPHEYNPRYKAWNASDLPFIPDVWELKPREEVDKKTRKPTGRPDPGTLAQIRAIKDLLASATEVIGAGDADGEGQLLQDELLIYLKNRAPVKRLWLSATDDASVAKAWAAMRPNSEYAGWYWSALARSHADFLAGINMSRACTISSRVNGGNAVLPFGRVQTPTLAIIVNLELAIRTFKPVKYFTPVITLATVPGFDADWAPNKEKDLRLDPEGRLLDKKVADSIVAACKAAGKATVTTVSSTKAKENPPLPYALSTLQEHMSKRYGMGVQDTLKYAQLLYEKKIASYPRTDCEFLPEAQHSEAGDIVAVMRAGVRELGPAPAKANLLLKSRAYDDKKVTAHHAIVPRPTTLAALADLSAQERLLWVEIAKRYLLQFFPAAEFLNSEIELLCADEKFRATGKVYTSRGWKDAFAVVAAIDPDDDDSEKETGSLPAVTKGQVVPVKDVQLATTTTKAPKRFKEGTLIAAMKNAYKYVIDPKLKAGLRDNAGIGTEATRANTIGELFGREFIVLSKNEIKPTRLAEELIGVLPRQISAPDMTALWQQAMDDIMKTEEKGYLAFMAAQKKWLTELVREVPAWFTGKSMSSAAGAKAAAKSGVLKTKPTTHTCLKCKGPLAHIEGKFGWFFGCQVEGCKTVFRDVGGLPVEKSAAPAGKVTIGSVSSGDKCPTCSKGILQARACGPHTKTPGKQFLSCSNFFAAGKAKCSHSVWP